MNRKICAAWKNLKDRYVSEHEKSAHPNDTHKESVVFKVSNQVSCVNRILGIVFDCFFFFILLLANLSNSFLLTIFNSM